MSVRVEEVAAGATARDEVKAYLRIEHAADDALIDRLVATAIGHGEAFTGQVLLATAIAETIPVAAEWRRLARTPVTAISAVEAQGVALAVDAYAVDVDAAGDGWVRIAPQPEAKVATVTYQAGLADSYAALPAPIRQGVIRLAAHLYTHRDAAAEAEPPAAVAALWRPWRRMRLS
jgi:uncharacterized phiE125 gp8 family phage protein